jgi:hypothetical protein
MSHKVKRFIGNYPQWEELEEIEKLLNDEGMEINGIHQSVATSTTNDLMVVTTVYYEDCND